MQKVDIFYLSFDLRTHSNISKSTDHNTNPLVTCSNSLDPLTHSRDIQQQSSRKILRFFSLLSMYHIQYSTKVVINITQIR